MGLVLTEKIRFLSYDILLEATFTYVALKNTVLNLLEAGFYI